LYPDLYVKEFLVFLAGIWHSALVTRRSEKGIYNVKPRTENREPRTKERIAEIIELTGIESEQHKKIGALSKGFRQRVGLAQALLHDPDVLILDEPTSGLDPNQLLEIRTLIKKIGKQKTVMLSTHIMQEVEAICDRAIIIHKGKIVADDSTKNLHTLSGLRNIIKVEFNSPVEPTLLLTIPGVIEAINPASNIRHPVSGIQHPASDTARTSRSN
jgi:ABC-2 type transport system ATP-binding protein